MEGSLFLPLPEGMRISQVEQIDAGLIVNVISTKAEALDHWLKCAKACHVAELTSFANGIYRDYAAVYAACSLSWSNGITEGHVNRLKYLKRQMFGRAHLDLLRVKVLHAV